MQKKIFPQEIKGRGDQEGKKGMQSRKEKKKEITEGNPGKKPRKEPKGRRLPAFRVMMEIICPK